MVRISDKESVTTKTAELSNELSMCHGKFLQCGFLVTNQCKEAGEARNVLFS